MAQIDPRKQPIRLSPLMFLCIGAIIAGSFMWRVIDPNPGSHSVMDPITVMNLETKAMAAISARPGFGQAEDLAIVLRQGETMVQAVSRTGVSSQEAKAAVELLGQAYDLKALKPGQSFEAALARPLGSKGEIGGPAQLLGITLRTGPAKQLTLTTSRDGAMRLRALEEIVREERRVAIGKIDGSLFTSAAALGASPSLTNQVMRLFAHKIDFERDIQTGDTFKLVFDRKVTESGRTVESGNLLYAEVEAKGRINRFYSYQSSQQSPIEFFDENGKNIKGFLLASPLYGVRSNSNFGMRRHPILGFMKMHTGIDFAANHGSPVQAAGAGVVVEAKWWGGYGRWVRIDHGDGWSTGYAHLSHISVRPGQKIEQGQVLGLVGSTGRSTGPHLHFEVWKHKQPIDPRSAKVPQGTVLVGEELAAFMARKREIDAMIGVADVQRADAEAPATAIALLKSPYRYDSQTKKHTTLTTEAETTRTALLSKQQGINSQARTQRGSPP